MSDLRRRRGPRGDVSAEGILRAATAVLDAAGESGLTLRAVAQEAGVTPNTIYTYFEDMGDLRNALGERFLARLDLDLLSAGSPRAALTAFLQHTLEVFAASPASADLLASQPVMGEHAMALNEALLDFFVDDAGVAEDRAVESTVLLVEWIHGRMLLARPNPAAAAYARAFARVPSGSFPRSRRMLSGPSGEDAIALLVAALVPTR